MNFSDDEAQLADRLMLARKSVAPNLFIDKPISRNLLRRILENAHRAPTHRLTQPWRFKVLLGQSKNELGSFMAKVYQEITPAEKFNERKFQGLPSKAEKSGAVILICMQRDQQESLPEWEETAAVAMAVQNMYLTCTANNIGCYWSSPAFISEINRFIPLNAGEKCLGIFYMGYYEKALLNSPREPIETRVEWYE